LPLFKSVYKKYFNYFSKPYQCSQDGIKSIALTLISTGTRIKPEQSIFSIAEGLANQRGKNIEIFWSFVDQQKLQLAEKNTWISERTLL